MTELFLKFVNMSIAASWLVLAVMLLRVLLKKAPKWLNPVLWGIVGLRLALPFSVESALSLIPSSETISPEIMYAREPAIHSGILALNQAVNPIITESFRPDPLTSANPLQILIPIAAVLWAAGMAAMLIYAGVSYLRLRRRVETAVWLRDNIYQSENVASPFVLGIIRPRIYLPFFMTDRDAALVLAHEQTHIRRHDHWIKPIGFLLLCLYWFNPMLWAAYILLCRDIELACDERVIREMGAKQRADYSEALLSCSVSQKMVAACPLAFGELGVKQRVKNILNYKKPAFWFIVLSIFPCVAVAVCFLTNPKEEALPAPEPFGQGYQVESVVYSMPFYSFAYTPETAPLYTLTSDAKLMVLEDKKSDNWLQAGEFTEEHLSPLVFDEYFKDTGDFSGWAEDALSPEKLRLSCEKAWRADVSTQPGHVFYLLLQAEDGALYLTYGYDEGTSYPEAEESSLIRWVFRLEPSENTGTGAYEAVTGNTYISSECLYMNLLSSYYPVGGDSGCRYIFAEDALIIVNRHSGSAKSMALEEGWEWQAFPYTDGEWNSLFVPGSEKTQNLSELYDEMLCLPLSGGYSLFRMDGQLWLVEIHENNEMGKFIWSIYSLTPENAAGSAQWKYQPQFSSKYPAFPLKFDLPYTKISAACDEGQLIGFDEKKEDGYPSGYSLTASAGSALYWSPAGEDGIGMAGDAVIPFSVWDGDVMTCSGTIYISRDPEVDGMYTAIVVGKNLRMKQSENTEGGTIYPFSKS